MSKCHMSRKNSTLFALASGIENNNFACGTDNRFREVIFWMRLLSLLMQWVLLWFDGLFEIVNTQGYYRNIVLSIIKIII